jgi:type I restriction enzyme, S subunit
MLEGLKPYPAMKDSGVPWLGKVPEHWGVRSLGSLTSEISRRGRSIAERTSSRMGCSVRRWTNSTRSASHASSSVKREATGRQADDDPAGA